MHFPASKQKKNGHTYLLSMAFSMDFQSFLSVIL